MCVCSVSHIPNRGNGLRSAKKAVPQYMIFQNEREISASVVGAIVSIDTPREPTFRPPKTSIKIQCDDHMPSLNTLFRVLIGLVFPSPLPVVSRLSLPFVWPPS